MRNSGLETKANLQYYNTKHGNVDAVREGQMKSREERRRLKPERQTQSAMLALVVVKQAAQYPGTLPSMFEQHIITDEDRRAHCEGKIAISLNYKAGRDPYLIVTSNNFCWRTRAILLPAQVEINSRGPSVARL